MLIPALVFISILAMVVGSYWFVIVVPENRGQSRLRRRLAWEDPIQASLDLVKKPDVLSTIASLDSLLLRLGRWSVPLKTLIDQAGLRLTVGSFLLLTLSSFFVAFLAVNAYFKIWWFAAGVGLVAAFVPLAVVRFMRTRRVRQFEEQFPESIELIARAMRAGHAFATGLKMASDEIPPPTGLEFRILYEKQNYGAQLPDALKTFAERVPSLDARFFVTAVLTQREAGGNLSEVLDRLASVMRDRFRIKREVRVRSAHGRMTAYVLAGMPPLLAAMIMSTNPDQFKLLLNDPLGIRLLIGAVVLQIVGTLIVRKLVAIEY